MKHDFNNSWFLTNFLSLLIKSFSFGILFLFLTLFDKISLALKLLLLNKDMRHRQDNDCKRIEVEVDAVVEPLDENVQHVEQAVEGHLVVKSYLLASGGHHQRCDTALNR